MSTSSVVYFGKGTSYNLAFISALEKAGYTSGGRSKLSCEGLGEKLVPDIVVVDTSLAPLEEIVEFLQGLHRNVTLKNSVFVAVVPYDEMGRTENNPGVVLLGKGIVNEAVASDSEPDVFVARVAVALHLANKIVPTPLVRSSSMPTAKVNTGDIIDHYCLDTVLGIGGMGVVYKATDINLDRTVALKVLLDDINLKKIQVERFLREGEIMARLGVPGIVKILDIGHEPVNYLVMEFIEGQDLEQIIEDHLLTPAEIVKIAISVAKSLHKIHEAGIIHRDLKPSNISVGNNGRIYILDFGISKLVDAKVLLTMPGTVLGTQVYMAPEQLDSRMGEVSCQTDIYALGLIMYESMVGVAPFHEKGIFNIIKEIVTGSPMAMHKVRPEIDPNLEKIILKATARKPCQRFATALEMAESLEKLDLTLPDYSVRKPGRAMP